jgi:hypothetical protein
MKRANNYLNLAAVDARSSMVQHIEGVASQVAQQLEDAPPICSRSFRRRQLDAIIDKATAGVEESIPLTKYVTLLMSIVGHSDHELDHTHLYLAEAYALLNTYDDLRDKLSDAWTYKSYREVRCLGT